MTSSRPDTHRARYLYAATCRVSSFRGAVTARNPITPGSGSLHVIFELLVQFEEVLLSSTILHRNNDPRRKCRVDCWTQTSWSVRIGIDGVASAASIAIENPRPRTAPTSELTAFRIAARVFPVI